MTTDRYTGNRAVIALLGLLAGLLLSVVHARDVRAQDLWGEPAGENAPERVFALTVGDHLPRFDGDTPRQTEKKDITGLRNGEGLPVPVGQH